MHKKSLTTVRLSKNDGEEEGCEPPVPVKVRRFSRPVHKVYFFSNPYIMPRI